MIFDAKGVQLSRGDVVWVMDLRLREAYVSSIRKDGAWYKLGLVFPDGSKTVREHTVGRFDEVVKQF